jgi:hypothetical protein
LCVDRYTIFVYTTYTMKNITLSAPEELIEKARRKAAAKGTTLNNEFRAWLESQTRNGDELSTNYEALIQRLAHVDSGGKFSRDEMNER